MKNIACISFILMAFFLQGQQQQFNITRGELVKEIYKDNPLQTLRDEKGGIFEIKQWKKKYFIKHYNSNMLLDGTYTHEVISEDVSKFFVLNHKLNIIDVVRDKDTKEAVFIVHVQNENELQFTSKKLFTVASYKDIGFDKKFNAILSNMVSSSFSERKFLFGLTVSKNQKYYSLSFSDFSLKKEAGYRFFLFNNLHELIFDKTIKLPQKEDDYFFNDFKIDENQKAVYFLGTDFPNGPGPSWKAFIYNYELHRVTATDLQTTTIPKEKLELNNLILHVSDTNEKITCVGLFSNESSFYDNGLAYFSFNKTNLQLINKVVSKFTSQYKSDTKSKKDKYYNLYIDNIFETENEDLYIVGEERNSINTGSQLGNSTLSTTYYFQNTFVVKMDKSGNLLWSRAVNKNQQTTQEPHSKFMSSVNYLHDNKISLIFNANIKPTTLRDSSLQYNFTQFKNIVPYLIRFDDNGNYKTNTLLEANEKILLQTKKKFSNLTEPKNIFLLGKHINKQQWFRFEIK